MNEGDIRKYAALMAELGLTGLEVTENDRMVCLERTPAAAAAPARGSETVQVFAPQLVKVGDRVRKGQTLCIVEAMKLMNEIMAEEDGEILEICAENGQVVDYGCRLFRLKRQS